MASEEVSARKPVFFSGDEALREVAKPDGLWNWALVGPDPDKMPLSGGGSGSIDELRHALGAQPSSFGLLRMTFGVGPKAKTKYIYVHASNVDDDSTAAFTMRQRGQALAKAPLMEKAMQKYVQTHVKVEITNQEDCCVGFIMEKLLKVSSVHAAFITVEAYEKAMEEFRAAHPISKEEEEKQVEAAKLVEDLAPAPEQHEPEQEAPEQKGDEEKEVTRQRKKVRGYKVGDLVMVWSQQSQGWHDDGEIVQVLEGASMHCKQTLSAGTIKVVYANGRRFKWIGPQDAESILRISGRPVPPPPRWGHLDKETHSATTTEWHQRFFELSKGFLTWWKERDDYTRKRPCISTVGLLGLQLKVEATALRFWTTSTKGQMFTVDTGSAEDVAEWAAAMTAHAEYMEKMMAHLTKHAEKDKPIQAPAGPHTSGHHQHLHRHHHR